MKTIPIALAMLLAANAAEARLVHPPRQAHPAAQQAAATPPPFAKIFGYESGAQQPQKAVRPVHLAPRPYARLRRSMPVYAAPIYARVHYARHRWTRTAFRDEAPPPRSIRYTRHAPAPVAMIQPPVEVRAYVPVGSQIVASSPAFYALTKVTAHTLGVTDHSLLFEPIALAYEKKDHFSAAAPWAGSLRW